MRVGSVSVLVFLGLFWCGITGVFDFVIARTIFLQLRALNFPAAEAQILQSSTVRKSKNLGVDIRFAYVVDGQRYESSRYRYESFTSTDSEWARVAVRQNPVGARRMIRYNPRDPSDAVLSPGLQGSDLFMLLFITPFNAIGFALLLAPFFALKQRLFPAELPGVRIVRVGMRTIARLPRVGPIAGAAVGLAVGAFIMIFVVMFTGSGFHPSLQKVTVAWSVVLAGALAIFIWRWMRIASGAEDLVIDPGAQTLSLPMTFGRKRRVLAQFSDVSGVTVRERIEKARNDSPSINYDTIVLFRAGAELSEAKLAEHPNAEFAERLAAWLRKQLGLQESLTT